MKVCEELAKHYHPVEKAKLADSSMIVKVKEIIC